jgi:hypothetical protein
MTHIFMDESGDAGFKFGKGSGDFFVIAAIIFDDDLEMEKTSVAIKSFKRKLGFEDYREFKFNKLSREVRLKLLKEVNKFRFGINYLAIDKRTMKVEELGTRSFYAYAVKTLIDSSKESMVNSKIKLDGTGDRAFRRNFLSYMRKTVRHDKKRMFQSFQFLDSRGSTLLQLADMIVGSLRRFHEGGKKDKDVYRNTIKKHIENDKLL